MPEKVTSETKKGTLTAGLGTLFSDLTKSEPDLKTSLTDLTKSMTDLGTLLPDLIKSEANLPKSEADLGTLTTDLTASMTEKGTSPAVLAGFATGFWASNQDLHSGVMAQADGFAEKPNSHPDLMALYHRIQIR